MNPQLNYMIVQQRSAELQRAGACPQPSRDVPAGLRRSRRSRRIARLTSRLACLTGRFAPTGP
jgi:hypothetical protein